MCASSLLPAVGRDPIFQPISERGDDCVFSSGERQAGAAIGAYLDGCISFARTVFRDRGAEGGGDLPSADDLIAVMLGHQFNYQSKGKVAPFLPDAKARFERAIAQGQPLRIYLLYHGGYRAVPDARGSALTFDVGVTELMLVYQIARLQEKIAKLYAPGIEFYVVINNGVAEFANDIPVRDTEGYVGRFEKLIAACDAERCVKLVVQSTFGDFRQQMRGIAIEPWKVIDPMHLLLVQRFLGRSCAEEEARWRAAAYYQAEAVWGREVRALLDSAGGVCCRQIATSVALSFRSFPGGASRVQNGTVGFRIKGETLTPTLITSTSLEAQPVFDAPIAGFANLDSVLPNETRRDRREVGDVWIPSTLPVREHVELQ